MTLLPPTNNATHATRLDQALALATDVDVSSDATLTYTYAKNNSTAVNTRTWVTQHDVYQLLGDCHGYNVDLIVYFNSPNFTTLTSKVEVMVRQKRFTTDTAITAPIIGAATLFSDTTGAIGKAGLRVPLSFVHYGENQASHGLIVMVDTTTTTLTTANLWLVEGDNYATAS